MRIFRVPGSELSMGPAPRETRDLEELRREGIQVLVTLLTPEEIGEIFPGLGAEWEAMGVRWMHYPIPDRGLPQSDFRDFLQGIPRVSRAYVHCRAGIGRSGLAVAALMVLGGCNAEASWRLLSEIRGCPVPDTEEQREWVLRLNRRGGMSLDEILQLDDGR